MTFLVNPFVCCAVLRNGAELLLYTRRVLVMYLLYAFVAPFQSCFTKLYLIVHALVLLSGYVELVLFILQ